MLHTMVKTEPEDPPLSPFVTVAAGSSSQLPQVKLEMKTNPQLAAHATVSKVKLLPFCVKLTRLSDAMIRKFTASNKEPYKRSTQKQYYPASQQLK